MTAIFDGPGTEQELNAIEALAAAMYRADRILLRGGTPATWELIAESVRQRFRDVAESWIEGRAA